MTVAVKTGSLAIEKKEQRVRWLKKVRHALCMNKSSLSYTKILPFSSLFLGKTGYRVFCSYNDCLSLYTYYLCKHVVKLTIVLLVKWSAGNISGNAQEHVALTWLGKGPLGSIMFLILNAHNVILKESKITLNIHRKINFPTMKKEDFRRWNKKCIDLVFRVIFFFMENRFCIYEVFLYSHQNNFFGYGIESI